MSTTEGSYDISDETQNFDELLDFPELLETVQNFLTAYLSAVRFDLGISRTNNALFNSTVLDALSHSCDATLPRLNYTNPNITSCATGLEDYNLTAVQGTWVQSSASTVDISFNCRVWQIKKPWAWINNVFGIAFSNFVRGP